MDSRSSDFFFDFNDNKDITYAIYNEHVAETTTEPKKCGCTAAYRCQDFFGTALYCKDCTVSRHQESPLHRIQHWDDRHFKCASLKDLGLQIQLGHPVWGRCCNPSPAFHNKFVVLDVNSVHLFAIDYCTCKTAQSSTTQLLHARWFPATTIDPRTATTFCLLHHFHILTFSLKASAFEVWQVLSRLMDNTSLSAPKDRYEALLRMVREWQNLMLLKQFGQGHDPAGVDATLEGSCAVTCPACPQPGKNLLQGWEDAPPEVRWLYGLFLAIDVNFHLAQKNVSSDKVDPSLSKGWAYFVEEDGYKVFLKDVSKELQEKSTCVSHSAVNLAETKNSHGLAATGARTINCARHNFKWPCAVGDLQKGEKYINMDFLFISTMQHAKDFVTLNVSYDIACQWSKHLWECMAWYPNWMHVKHGGKITTFLVLKFHLPAHIFSCQITYSHNLVEGMGRTDGEAPEHGWANINPVATSTCEMGLGSQYDMLNDHFGDFNWKKVANLEHYQHQRDFDEFNETLITEHLEEVGRWKQGVEEWEADMSATNPFSPMTANVTQASVRLTLSQEESEELKCSINNSLHTEISPAVLISSGMGIEDEQHRLLRDLLALHDHLTNLQCLKLQDCMNILQCKVDQWCQVQKVHTIILFLPSAIPSTLPCDEHLLNHKWDLCEAQANDALNNICSVLNMKYHLYNQCANTCATGIINNVDNWIDALTAKYNAVQNVLVNLVPRLHKDDNWLLTFKPLNHTKDAVPLRQDNGAMVGQQTVSWIWKTCGVSDNMDFGLQDSHQWEEEVQSLYEEMRHVLAFFEWQAVWWDLQGSHHTFRSPEAAEGAVTYAHWQALLQWSLASHFRSLWGAIPLS
ncbi:hypothetical protein BDR06DRAFT_982211 [Suillus hirtellus]|nr:hypothetical protein BDR06DRAFT_982211 [Suillus hirtellus]